MDAKIKEKWVSALRSGEYTQGRNRLRDNNSFCCLGVLCDLAAEENVGTWNELDQFCIDDKYFTSAVLFPPEAVTQNWAGFSNSDMELVSYLAENNDQGFSFTTIAEYIEENF